MQQAAGHTQLLRTGGEVKVALLGGINGVFYPQHLLALCRAVEGFLECAGLVVQQSHLNLGGRWRRHGVFLHWGHIGCVL